MCGSAYPAADRRADGAGWSDGRLVAWITHPNFGGGGTGGRRALVVVAVGDVHGILG
jgi:hypothetical protein